MEVIDPVAQWRHHFWEISFQYKELWSAGLIFGGSDNSDTFRSCCLCLRIHFRIAPSVLVMSSKHVCYAKNTYEMFIDLKEAFQESSHPEQFDDSRKMWPKLGSKAHRHSIFRKIGFIIPTYQVSTPTTVIKKCWNLVFQLKRFQKTQYRWRFFSL